MSLEPKCLFCQIVQGEIAVQVLHRTDEVMAFIDIAPQAPQHVLVIPTNHIAAVSQHTQPAALGGLVAQAARIGAELGQQHGFRLVVNEGPQGGQTVDHLHVHVLAGRQMTWPPG